MGESSRWRGDLGAAVDALPALRTNYDESEAPTDADPGDWHRAEIETSLGSEAPGPPVPDGPWATAVRLMGDYEFADPAILRAHYRADSELLGRNMLLEGRFGPLRLHLGVRVTEVVDETRGTERVWGWAYRTLEGHLEQGELWYEVVKDTVSGAVAVRVHGYSRPANIEQPVVALGFHVFGGWMQQRFYRAVGHRLRRLVPAARSAAGLPAPEPADHGLVLAPSDSRPGRGERFSLLVHRIPA